MTEQDLEADLMNKLLVDACVTCNWHQIQNSWLLKDRICQSLREQKKSSKKKLALMKLSKNSAIKYSIQYENWNQ